MWTPKKNSGFEFTAPGAKKKSKSSTKKSKSKSKSKTSTTSRKKGMMTMCKNIDAALKDKNVKRIIINK